MSKKELVKFSGFQIVLIIFVLVSLFEGFIIIKLSRENESIRKSFILCCDDYDKSTQTHPYNIRVFNYDRNLHDVVLKYKTFAYKTISIGNLAALDINLKDPNEKEKNRKEYETIIPIDDMASPIYFEVIGKHDDGTIFEGNVSGFDIQSENETFEVYIYKDREGLSYQ